MPLSSTKFQSGFDKQSTSYGAEGKWVDGENIRFRYGQPEKIGGCAGGGVQGLNVRIISGAIYVYAGGFMADYGFFGSTSFSTTFGGLSLAKTSLDSILNATGGTVTGSGVTLGSNGRDTITCTAVATMTNNVLTISVFYQCKGGTYPDTPGGKPQVQISSNNTENLYTFTWSNPT